MGPFINDEGYIAFAANTFNFSANPPYKNGIWSGPTNDLQPVCLSSFPVPGLPGVTFDNPYNNVSIKLGVGRTVCFFTALAGAGVNSTNNVGLFIGSSTHDVRLLARIGDQAPGLPQGVTFSSIPGDAVVLFGSNRVAFRAVVAGPGVSIAQNDRALWITDDEGAPRLVGRIGDTIHTDSGDISVGGDFVMQHDTGRDGLSSCGNRSDQLAVFNAGVFTASYAYLITAGTHRPSAPLIDFSMAGTGLKLSWPTGYHLEFTPALPPTTWSTLIVSSPFIVPITNRQAFYRLAPP